MRVTKFYVGFPPAVVKRSFGETEYGIGLIPLGGFVRIVGMGRPRGRDLRACAEAAEKAAERRPPDQPDRRLTPALERARATLDTGDAAGSAEALALLSDPLERDTEPLDAERVGWCRKELERVSEDADPRAYWRQATWRRVAAITAGPGANVLAAFAILTVFYALGVPNYEPTTSVQQVQVSSPAQRMGLRPGDVVVGVQGQPVKSVATIRPTIETSGHGDAVACAGPAGRRTLGPAAPRKVGDQRLLGFVFDVRRSGTLHFGLVRSAHLAEQELWLVTKGTGQARRNFVLRGDRSESAGRGGIVREQRSAVETGASDPEGSSSGRRFFCARSSTCCRSCRWTAATSCSR